MDVNVKDETINVEQQSGNQVIHVRANSDSEMEALFDCVLKPSGKAPLQVPLKLRNLPESFFIPPAHRQSPAPIISHSREGSADSSYGSSGTPVGRPPPLRVSGAAGAASTSQPQHFRHHSSPATMQPSALSVAPPQHVHAKQHSYDALADEPLPSGWEEARTSQGQVFYLNHKTQSTTWEDPRKKLLSQPQSSSQPSPPGSSVSSSAQSQQATSLTPSQPPPPPPPPPPLISSPPSQTTILPSIAAMAISTAPVSSVGNPPGISTPSTTSASSTSSSTSNAGAASSVGLVNPNLGPLPPGWQQGLSPDGEIYFINHNDQTTTWFDPRIPRQLQTSIGLKAAAAAAQQQNLQQSSNTQEYAQKRGVRGEVSPNRTISDIQSQPQLRSQVSSPLPPALPSALPANLNTAPPPPIGAEVPLNSNTLNLPTSQQGASNNNNNNTITSSTSNTLNSTDPFMAATTDFHSRQESADSGLGLGVNFTHPTTPEDFLNTMDDGDNTMADVEMRQNVASPMVTSEFETMDSDDLVPSISIEGISPEMLDEMLVGHHKLNWV